MSLCSPPHGVRELGFDKLEAGDLGVHRKVDKRLHELEFTTRPGSTTDLIEQLLRGTHRDPQRPWT